MNKITQLAKHDLVDQDFIRVITLHTSESTPVVTRYMTVGKGAFQLTDSIQVQPFVSAKQKTKNRQRNKLARKARGKK